MLNVNLDEQSGLVILTPVGELTKADFTNVAIKVDPYINKNGKVKGVVIHTKAFPGWDSFEAFSAHFRFARDHQREVNRVAICTDSKLKNLAGILAPIFLKAEVKTFDYANFDKARAWALCLPI